MILEESYSGIPAICNHSECILATGNWTKKVKVLLRGERLCCIEEEDGINAC